MSKLDMKDVKGEELHPPSGSNLPVVIDPAPKPAAAPEPGFMDRLFAPFRKKNNGDGSMRDTLEEILEERDDQSAPLAAEETQLLKNVIGLHERTIEDVSVPRGDICAVSQDESLDGIIKLMTREGHSRLPVYGEDLDDPLGMVHIRDILAYSSAPEAFNLKSVMRKVLFVTPSARVPELMLEMRTTRIHMALVIDEYGGTDGLVTIEDLVEEIVGEIEDEHDDPEGDMFVQRHDGSIDADARWELDDMEGQIGTFLNEDERDDVDTLGGLVFLITGRIPLRGEIITHGASGLEFEILDTDPRRISRLRIRNAKILKTSPNP